MARMYISDSEDDLPDLDDIIKRRVRPLQPPTIAKPSIPANTSKSRARTSPSKKAIGAPAKEAGIREFKQKLTLKQPEPESSTSAKKTTRTLQARPIFRLPTSQLEEDEHQTESRSADLQTYAKARATPRRGAKKVVDYAALLDEEEEKEDVEESIWCGSSKEESERDESEAELPTARMLFPSPRKTKLGNKRLDGEKTGSDSDANRMSKSIFGASDSSDKENDAFTTLRFSPPTARSKPKALDLSRPSTPPPPTSPTKSRLVSPSKKKARIPTPPHRPSIDAFWSIHQVNDWNDAYSPQKPLLSPKKSRFLFPDNNISSTTTPLASPGKAPLSPSKRSKAAIEAKKDFESRKHALATSFLNELDLTVTNGQIATLAASTGGVQIIWSKTLNTTAGRANWKRETHRTRLADGSTETSHKHHASIELAEKVIDDAARLRNVVAHEFCHLANFMVSGIKDQPHGKQFKLWGAEVTRLFAKDGVEVTTKHSYQIEYKYVWACTQEGCGYEHKRHSKSVDPSRHVCGVCRGRLVQVKPVPRKGKEEGEGKAGDKAGVTGYARFVKENFASVKKEVGTGKSHKEVMEALGRRYREQKAVAEEEEAKKLTVVVEEKTGKDVDDVAKAFEVITLDD